MRRRGFTLLEILITLALITLVAALSIPSLMRFSDERVFEDGAELIIDQLVLARAAAQELGEPLEVVFRPVTRDILVRRYQAASTGPKDFISLGLEDRDRNRPDRTAAASMLTESWTRLSLPGTLALSHRRPVFSDDVDPAAGGEASSGDPAAFDSTSVTVAVFLADGTAMETEGLWLFDDDRRIGNLRINPWTGLPRYEREMDRPDALVDAPEPDAGDAPRETMDSAQRADANAALARPVESAPGSGSNR